MEISMRNCYRDWRFGVFGNANSDSSRIGDGGVCGVFVAELNINIK
jgi:hypothetical protein